MLSQSYKQSKSLFKDVITYINDNNIKLNETQSTHIKELVKKWRNNKHYTIHEYIDIQTHHKIINNTLSLGLLSNFWNTYLFVFDRQLDIDASKIDCKILQYYDDVANNVLNFLLFNNPNELLGNEYIQQFINETYKKKCYIIEHTNNEIASLCLLRKCDFDPYQNISKKQKDPYALMYIYTFKKYRNQSYALKLLKNIKENITAFCNCEESINLFKKANYVFLQNDSTHKHIAIYRTNNN